MASGCFIAVARSAVEREGRVGGAGSALAAKGGVSNASAAREQRDERLRAHVHAVRAERDVDAARVPEARARS